MDLLPVAMIMGRAAAEREARSALPDAPVVPEVARGRRPVAARPRRALAAVLERAARAVAPARDSAPRNSASCSPAP